jgi:hypothetical protein
MQWNAEDVAAFALLFRRVGADLMTFPHKTARPPFMPVGANGNGTDDDEGEDYEDDDEEMGPAKRLRPRGDGSPGQPPRKRQRRSLQELRALIDRMPEELLLDIFSFTLYPRFLPAYTLYTDTTVSPTQSSQARLWTPADPKVRHARAIEEIQQLAKTFGSLSATSQQFQRVVNDKFLRIGLYRRWLLQPLEPFWPRPQFDEHVGFDRQVRHTAARVDGVYSRSVPELDTHVEATEGWYSEFLANVFFNWYLGQFMRDQWKMQAMKALRGRSHMVSGNPPRQVDLGWDGRYYTYQELTGSGLLWPGIKAEENNWWHFKVGTMVNIGSTLYKLSSSVPGYVNAHIMSSGSPDFPRHGWMSPTVEQFISPRSRYFQKDSGEKTPEIARFALRSLIAITVIRLPSLEIPRGSYIDQLSPPDVGITTAFDFARATLCENFPTLIWDPPLYWKPKQRKAYPKVEKRILWPHLTPPIFAGLTVASTERAGKFLSLLAAIHVPRVRIDLANVFQQKDDGAMIIDYVSSGFYIDDQRVLIGGPKARIRDPVRLKRLEIQYNPIKTKDQIPAYMQGYRIVTPWADTDVEDDGEEDT